MRLRTISAGNKSSKQVIILLGGVGGKKMKLNDKLKEVQTRTRGAMHHHALPCDLTGPTPQRVALISELFNGNLN